MFGDRITLAAERGGTKKLKKLSYGEVSKWS